MVVMRQPLPPVVRLPGLPAPLQTMAPQFRCHAVRLRLRASQALPGAVRHARSAWPSKFPAARPEAPGGAMPRSAPALSVRQILSPAPEAMRSECSAAGAAEKMCVPPGFR